MLESKIQTKIIKLLESIPHTYVIRPIVCSKRGNPDIIALIDGIYVAIEVKQPNKKPTNLQLSRINKIKQAGGIAFVAHSTEEAKIELDKITKAKIIAPLD